MVQAVTDANFVEATKDGVVLIDFWATWCGPCRMQAPILEQLASEVDEDELRIFKMDVDENPGGGYYWVCDSCGLTVAVGDPSSNWKLGDPCSPTRPT